VLIVKNTATKFWCAIHVTSLPIYPQVQSVAYLQQAVVQRWYQDRKMTVTPINPKGGSIEGVDAATRLSDMVTSETADACAVSIITPPAVTTNIVQEAYSAGITRIWMQPGSESAEAVSFGKEHNMTVVHDYCILVSGDQAMSQASKM